MACGPAHPLSPGDTAAAGTVTMRVFEPCTFPLRVEVLGHTGDVCAASQLLTAGQFPRWPRVSHAGGAGDARPAGDALRSHRPHWAGSCVPHVRCWLGLREPLFILHSFLPGSGFSRWIYGPFYDSLGQAGAGVCWWWLSWRAGVPSSRRHSVCRGTHVSDVKMSLCWGLLRAECVLGPRRRSAATVSSVGLCAVPLTAGRAPDLFRSPRWLPRCPGRPRWAPQRAEGQQSLRASRGTALEGPNVWGQPVCASAWCGMDAEGGAAV